MKPNSHISTAVINNNYEAKKIRYIITLSFEYVLESALFCSIYYVLQLIFSDRQKPAVFPVPHVDLYSQGKRRKLSPFLSLCTWTTTKKKLWLMQNICQIYSWTLPDSNTGQIPKESRTPCYSAYISQMSAMHRTTIGSGLTWHAKNCKSTV